MSSATLGASSILVGTTYMSYNHQCYHRGMIMHHQMNMNIHDHLLEQLVQDHQCLSSQNIYICYLPVHRHKVWLCDKNLLQRCFMTIFV